MVLRVLYSLKFPLLFPPPSFLLRFIPPAFDPLSRLLCHVYLYLSEIDPELNWKLGARNEEFGIEDGTKREIKRNIREVDMSGTKKERKGTESPTSMMTTSTSTSSDGNERTPMVQQRHEGTHQEQDQVEVKGSSDPTGTSQGLRTRTALFLLVLIFATSAAALAFVYSTFPKLEP